MKKNKGLKIVVETGQPKNTAHYRWMKSCYDKWETDKNKKENNDDENSNIERHGGIYCVK